MVFMIVWTGCFGDAVAVVALAELSFVCAGLIGLALVFFSCHVLFSVGFGFGCFVLVGSPFQSVAFV